MKKFFLALIGIVIAVCLLLLFNTLTFESKQISYTPVKAVDVADDVLERFSKAIQFRTISYNEHTAPDSIEFLGFQRFLKESFPLVDSMLEKEVINDYALLYKWTGTDTTLKPIILMSHQDVVPVDQPTLDQWSEAPFSGKIKDGKIWGRGTMDDKGTLMAIYEAVELLLAKGYQTQRTIYLAFGHDEEIGGKNGAVAIADYLKKQGVMAEFTLDEGGVLAEGQLPGLDNAVAVINVAEKGYVSYVLKVQTEGGHSSQPPAENTIGILAKAITQLEENQRPVKLVKPLQYMVDYAGPELPFVQKMVFANSWLFGNQIADALNGRTTTAPTIIQGGIKDNVIPTVATATINFRILPGETSASVLEHIKSIVSEEYISIEAEGNISEPSSVSDPHSPSFQILQKTIGQLFPDAVVIPGLVGGGTDSRHFREVTENTYRFYPIRFNNENKHGFHGIGEHMTTENYKECIQFVYQLVQNVNE